MRKALILGVALTVALLAARFVQNRRNGARLFTRLNPVVEVLDADEDGTISAAELARAPAALRSLDSDKNGSLSEDELAPRAGRSGRREADQDEMASTLMSFDKNGDGKLSLEEVPERLQGLFGRGDANRDGALTREEIRALAERSAAAAARAEFWMGDFMRVDPVVSALDADHDRVISAAEISNAAVALKGLDRDGDGKISLDEMRPARPGKR